MSAPEVSDSLKMTLEQQDACRELYRYLKKGVDNDLKAFGKGFLRGALEDRIPTLANWNFNTDNTSIAWHPKDWEVIEDNWVALYVYLLSPAGLDGEQPSVNLFVPEDWPGIEEFSDRSLCCVQPLLKGGFDHVSDENGYPEFVTGRYVPWLKSDGTFDPADFAERLACEAEKVVRLEPEITRTIQQICANSEANRKTRKRKK